MKDCFILWSLVAVTGTLFASTVVATGSDDTVAEKTGTWTYHSTKTVTTTIPVLTHTYVPLAYEYITITAGLTYTSTLMEYTSTVTDDAPTTETRKTVVDRTYVEPPQTGPTRDVVTVPTPDGFTPILSGHPYTASVEVVTTVTTSTYALSTISVPVPSSTSTINRKETVSPPVEFTTTTIAGTSTSRVTHSVWEPFTTTLLRPSFPTRHAICQEDSGNYADSFPIGEPLYPKLVVREVDGQDHIDELFHFNIANKVDCCDFAMSQGQAVFGLWLPQGYLSVGGPLCAVYTASDSQSCKPREAALWLQQSVKANDTEELPAVGQYFAFNGECGQAVPSSHEESTDQTNSTAQTDNWTKTDL